MTYPRDLAGYGAAPPDPRWPGRARVALQFVMNYEEGGERSILHGDAEAESFLQEVVGFLYDSDAYNDVLPYWVEVGDTPHLVIPYTLDNNDMKFGGAQGFNTGADFFTYLKDAFDVLYAEGADHPKMMSVGLHMRLAGRPGRAAALARFLDYVGRHDRVWICRRVDIARHWIATHPFEPRR